METAITLLSHVNPETRLPLRDDPVLAWATLAGELSLFDLIDDPNLLPSRYTQALRERQQQSPSGTGRRFWQAAESEQWSACAEALRQAGLRAPLAGSSHWRREPEFAAVQIARGLDLIDDRLYWHPAPWVAPEQRSLLFDTSGGLGAQVARKRRPDRPYVVGEFAEQTYGGWAWPYEAADLMAVLRLAAVEDWDALVRRGVAPAPRTWGEAVPGTSGPGGPIVVPEALNGIPPVFALLPHAASVLLRGRDGGSPQRRLAESLGRVAIETPHSVLLAGWNRDRPLNAETLVILAQSEYAVVAASAVGSEPLAKARRLLVTAVARAQPAELAWVDSWRRGVADPGRPTILMEPVRGRVLWKGQARVEAHILDNTGKRLRPAKVENTPEGAVLNIDGTEGAVHWELIAS